MSDGIILNIWIDGDASHTLTFATISPALARRMERPIDIQELLESCIWPLRDSLPDMRACALVARRWLHAAQPHIFHEISIQSDGAPPPTPISRFLAVLHASPHLIKYIVRLDLVCQAMGHNGEAFYALCSVNFTHLEHVSVHPEGGLGLESARAIQQLLSAPALQRVQLTCVVGQLALFAQIWGRCAPGIRHLELSFTGPLTVSNLDDADLAELQSTPKPPVALESLRLGCPPHSAEWLTDPLWPLDLSALKVFSRRWHTVLPWPRVVPALRSIEVLDLIAMVRHTASGSLMYIADPSQQDDIIDLAWFPHLTLLRIELIRRMELPVALRILSSLPPENRLRRLILSLPFFDDALYAVLAAALPSLPLHAPAMFELELDPTDYELAAPYFQDWARAPDNTLCHTDLDYDSHWFQVRIQVEPRGVSDNSWQKRYMTVDH
ncbi:hypothetical protein FB451DRAFT_1460920 [Mycena latifolia]|nr:hypothetical protein FB451DRAFT_1460920 [Mycena latifolia]